MSRRSGTPNGMYFNGPSLYWAPLVRVFESFDLSAPAIEAPIAWDQYVEACERLIDATEDPFIGLEVGHRMSIGTHGLLGHAALSCSTLGESLDLLIRFPPFHEEGGRADLSIEGDSILLGYLPPVVLEGAPRFFTDMFFAAIVQSAKELAGDAPSRFKFELEGATTGQIDERFTRWIAPTVPARIRRDRLRAPLEMLSSRIESGAVPVAQLHKQLCEQLLQQSLAGEGMAGVVRRHLVADGAPYPSVFDVADAVGLHERTLRRRLKGEATSYQALLDEVRCHMASEYLAGSSMPTTTIARSLGYSDHANFSRAFQRWTGKTPSAFRLGSHEVTPGQPGGAGNGGARSRSGM